MSLLLGQEAVGIICQGLGLSQTAAGRTDVFFTDIDLGGAEALRVVGAHRADDGVEGVLVARAHAEE